MSAARGYWGTSLEVDFTACTGGGYTFGYRLCFRDEEGGPLDAPVWIAAGGMSSKLGEYVGLAVLR